MADIDFLIAGGRDASSRADFSGIADIPKNYWEGLDQNYKNKARTVFKDGIPLNDDGTPNYSEAAKKLYQLGDIGQGNAVSTLGIQRDQLALGQKAAAALGAVEGGTPAPATPPASNLPPSTSRSGAVSVAPPITGGQPQATGRPAATGDRPGSIVGIVSAAGVPDELAGPIIAQVSAITKSDPNAPVDPNIAPRVAQIVQATIARNRGQGQSGAAPGGPTPQSTAQPAQPAVAQPSAPQPVQPQPAAAQPADAPPQVVDRRGNAPTTIDPNIQQRAALYTSIMSNPAYPQSVRDAAKMRLEALQKNSELTGNQKEYEQYVRQGGTGTLQEFLAENEAKKTAATEEAKIGAKRYETLVDAGVKSQVEIPQLEMLQKAMEDPNFYSGVGEKYNLLAKRLKSAIGLDPDAAVPQEMLRKVTASSVLGSFAALKGLGPIRVAEMNLAKDAAASPDNSIPANKLLVEIQKRTYQRNADIAEMAQNYKQQNGTLDAGFDKKVTQYFKDNPMFTDKEIDNFHRAIAPKMSPADHEASLTNARAAIAAGKPRDAIIKRLEDNGIDTAGL